ncbi:MAG: metallophosphoesterase family protein [Candidatus Nanohaloarchaea archaeon]|nr:metallophosphoesterase family protein [Candidatus Nanohaloarchaea archaeon]
MKILAAADFHEKQDIIDAVVREANNGGYDLFLAPGDFVTSEDYEDLMERVEIPKLACTGNWDFNFTPPENDEFDHLFNFMKVEFEDHYIGIIGAVFPDDYVDEIIDWVEEVDRSRLLFMSHYPPERIGDLTVSGNRAGMSGFRELIMKTKPAAWFCGHIHEAFGHYSLMKTEVFNCAAVESGKAFSVDLGEDGVGDVEEVELI